MFECAESGKLRWRQSGRSPRSSNKVEALWVVSHFFLYICQIFGRERRFTMRWVLDLKFVLMAVLTLASEQPLAAATANNKRRNHENEISSGRCRLYACLAGLGTGRHIPEGH